MIDPKEIINGDISINEKINGEKLVKLDGQIYMFKIHNEFIPIIK
jgi:hypothetical protein